MENNNISHPFVEEFVSAVVSNLQGFAHTHGASAKRI